MNDSGRSGRSSQSGGSTKSSRSGGAARASRTSGTARTSRSSRGDRSSRGGRSSRRTRRARRTPPVVLLRRGIAIAIWAFTVWLVLTWTVTAEQLTTGALVAILVAVAMAPLGGVVRPWRLLDPRRFAALVALMAMSLVQIVRANISLAIRIWRPSRPLKSGMVVVPTTLRSDGGLASVGLISSLIVDNQIVDLDREQHLLQYHAVEVPKGTKAEQAEAINAPIERLIAKVERNS